MSKDLHNDEEITIDLLEIANIMKRNAGNIARVTGIFVVAAGVYLATATPVYESQALLRVKQPKGIGTSLLESMPMGNAMANTQLLTGSAGSWVPRWRCSASRVSCTRSSRSSGKLCMRRRR